MRKTLFITLAGISLVLTGCIQQTPARNQNLNQPALNQNQNTNQPVINTNQNINKQECERKECPKNYTQYYIPDCGLGPNGPIPCPPGIKQQEDCLCHKQCWKNGDKDCPTDMPKCKTVLISDTGQNLCFTK